MITKEEFGQAILDCFSEVYGKCFTGKIVISKLPDRIDVGLGLFSDIDLLHISAQLNEEEFIPFFKKELKRHRIDASKHASITRVS